MLNQKLFENGGIKGKHFHILAYTFTALIFSGWLASLKLERGTDSEQDLEVAVPALLVEAHQNLLAELIFLVVVVAKESALALGHKYQVQHLPLVWHNHLTLRVVGALQVGQNAGDEFRPALEV